MTIAVTRPVAQGYGCQIGDDYFRLVPSSVAPIRAYSQDSLAPRQQQSDGSQGDNVLAIGHAFGRQNLTGGEGLDWWPRPAGEPNLDFDIIRFWDSANIDIRRPRAGQPYSTTMSKVFEDFVTPASTPVDIGASQDSVYLAEGSHVLRYSTWGDTTAEDDDNLGNTIVMMDVGIDDVVVSTLSNGDIYIKPADSEVHTRVYDASAQPTPNALAAWWVKGRILAACKDSTSAENGQLIEVAPGIGGTPASPSVTPTVTLIDTYTGDMLSCVDAGHAIVGGFSDGSLRSYVPQTDSSGITPVLTVRARTQAPKHVVPLTLGWSLGQLLIMTLEKAPTGTNKILRLYTTTVQDERFDYAVGGQNMQLIRTWDGVEEDTPAYTKQFTTSRDEAFFAVGEGANNWNVWRYDFVTQGVFRHIKAERAAVAGLTLYDGRLALCDGADVVLESDQTYAATGYLITPNVTFGLNTPIAWASFIMEVLHLETSGVKVEMYRSTNPEAILDPDSADWILVRAFTDVSQSGVEVPTVGIEGNTCAIQLKFYSSTSGTVAPDVQRFAMRGLPVHRDYVVELPVNISDLVTAPGRMPLRVPGIGDAAHETLIAMAGQSKTCTVYDTPIVVRGQVEATLETIPFMSDRGSQGRYCMVRVLGKLIDGAAADVQPQGDDGMGIGTMGIATMGIGEGDQ